MSTSRMGGTRPPTVICCLFMIAVALLGWHSDRSQKPVAAAPVAGPDLVVELKINGQAAYVPALNEPVEFTATVRNRGTAAAAGDITLHFYVDPPAQPPAPSGNPRCSLPGLAAGDSFDCKLGNQTFAAEGCDHAVYAWVDQANTVFESEETNNLATLPLCVGVTCEVDPYETDNVCADGKWIGVGTAQAHTFCHPTDQNLSDEDWVRFTAFAGVTYTLATSNVGPNAAPQIALYADCGGALLSGPSGQVHWTPPTGAAYAAKVVQQEGVQGALSAYSLTLTGSTGVSDDYEPDDACVAARDITPDGARQTHRFQIPGDEDWVKFSVEAGQSFIVIADNKGPGVNPQIALFNSCSQAASGGVGLVQAANQVGASAVTARTLYVQVKNQDPAVFGANAHYDLSATASSCSADSLEEDDSPAQATTLAIGGDAQTHTVCPIGDEDWVKFSAQAGKIYVLQTSQLAAAADTVLELFDTDGATVLLQNDDYGYVYGSRIVWEAPATGLYFGRVHHHNPAASGSDTQYRISVQEGFCKPDSLENSSADNGPGDAAAVPAEGKAQKHNFCADPLRTDLGDQDWLRFDAVAGGNYQVRTSALGANSDTVLELYASDGRTHLQTSDDAGLGRAANLHYTATASGAYFVRVTQYNSAITGSETDYQVEFLADEPPPPTPPPTPTPPPPTPTPEPEPSTVETIILVNRSRVKALYDAAQADALMAKLIALAGHDKVKGVVVPVENNTAVAAAYAAWTADSTTLKDADKANAVAGAIRNLLLTFIGNKPNVRQVIIVGDDRMIPFRRVPDRVSPQGPSSASIEPNYAGSVAEDGAVRAALADGMILTDDYLVDQEPSTWQDAQKNTYEFYLPDYATGRLIETPAEIMAFIDHYLGGDMTIHTSKVLVTAYDFLQDSASVIKILFANDELNPDAQLIGPVWPGDLLRTKYLAASPRFDVYAVAGHSTHLAAGAPDKKDITAAEIAAASTDLAGALVYSMGCHAGLNDPGALDLPQAYMKKGANYVGNTGYGWGSGGVVYTEALIRNYSRELVRDLQAPIGPALAAAKIKYYSQAKRNFDAFDAKILMQTTFYGLPMVEMTSGATLSGEDPFPSAEPLFSSPAAFGNLAQGSVGYRLPTAFDAFGEQTGPQGTAFDLDGSVSFSAGNPVQPQYFANAAAPAAGQLHGVVLLGAVYTEVAGIDPVITTPYNEYVLDRSEPEFNAEQFSPAVPFALRSSASVPGATDTVVMSLGQFKSGPGLATASLGVVRIFDQMSFGTFYSDSPDQTAPAVTFVDGVLEPAGDRGRVKVEATDDSGVHRVVVAYDAGQGRWQSVDLAFDTAAQKWTGIVTGTVETAYFVQAVDGAGNTAIEDNKGRYYRLAVPLPLAAGQPVADRRIFLPLTAR